jgi:hypothetical protein
MAEHRSMQVDSLNATLNIDVDTAEEDEGALLVDDRQFISYTDLEFVKVCFYHLIYEPNTRA